MLGRLAVSSDRALAPLAREKNQLTGFIESAGDTATATAERRTDIARGLERLPRFLRELDPLMADLQGFAKQATPVATNLNRSGRDVSRVFQALGPFSRGAQPSLETLGDALRTGRPAVLRTRPLVQDLGRFARQARPLSGDLDKLTASLDKTDSLERLMETIFFTTLVINGYRRTGLLPAREPAEQPLLDLPDPHPGWLQLALRGGRHGVGGGGRAADRGGPGSEGGRERREHAPGVPDAGGAAGHQGGQEGP